MKHMLAVLTCGLLAAATVVAQTGSQTQAPPTVDQILEKYIAAAGGRAAIEKLTSVHARGAIQVTDVGLSGTIELFQKAPDKAATIVDLTGVGRQREGFDGVVAWTEDPQNGVREKTGVELAEARHSAIFARELKLKSLFPTITIKGRELVGGRDAYILDALPAEGKPVRFFFDVESGLMLRSIVSRLTPQGPLDVDVTFEDYRVVDGIKRPFTIRQATSMFTAVIQLSEIKHNVPIDDATFKKPGG